MKVTLLLLDGTSPSGLRNLIRVQISTWVVITPSAVPWTSRNCWPSSVATWRVPGATDSARPDPGGFSAQPGPGQGMGPVAEPTPVPGPGHHPNPGTGCGQGHLQPAGRRHPPPAAHDGPGAGGGCGSLDRAGGLPPLPGEPSVKGSAEVDGSDPEARRGAVSWRRSWPTPNGGRARP